MGLFCNYINIWDNHLKFFILLSKVSGLYGFHFAYFVSYFETTCLKNVNNSFKQLIIHVSEIYNMHIFLRETAY